MSSDYPHIQKLFPDYSILFTSSGTSAFYLALKCIEQRLGLGEVIIPSTICPTIPLAAIQAGFTVRFCDVNKETFCLSLETIKPHVNTHTRAILVAYLFGKAFEVQKIKEYADNNRIVIIEDIAQAIGGKINNKFLGNSGDMTILSFNPKKIVGKTNAGCLLFKDDTDFVIAAALEQNLSSAPKLSTLGTMKNQFREMTMSYFESSRREKYLIPTLPFIDLFQYYSGAFMFSSELTTDIKQKLDRELMFIDEFRINRFMHYELYMKYLIPSISVVKFTSDDMIWRLPIIVPTNEHQRRVIYELRKAGYLVSDHYFPMSVFMGQKGCYNAELIGLNAINLWVDHSVSHDVIIKSAQLVNSILAENV